MQQHLFEHFQSPGHTGFVDVCTTFIGKTGPFIPTKLQLCTPLISRKVFSCPCYVCCFVQIIFNIFDASHLYLDYNLGLDSDSRGEFRALSVISVGAFCQNG